LRVSAKRATTALPLNGKRILTNEKPRAMAGLFLFDWRSARSESDQLCMDALVQRDLQQLLGVHLVRVELNDKQMWFFIVVRHAHHASASPDCVCDLNPAIMRD
jgi:hypothetical protein